ncbi:MAG TPA: BTAD domain-containing putative transcriptional regulator [Gaiella sp.]
MSAASVSLPRHHVPRPRLAAELARGRLGAIVAGGGYGKTTLAIEYADHRGIAWALARLEPGDELPDALLARIRASLRRAGLSDAADALDPDGGSPDELLDRLLGVLAESEDAILLVLDEIGRVGGGAGDLVARLLDELPGDSELLLVGRSLPTALEPALSEPSVVRLGQTELAFTAEETGAVLERGGASVDAGWAARVRRVTQGWPIAVQLAAERLARADDAELELERLESTPSILSDLVEESLGALAPEKAAGVAQLAHLPHLTTWIADRATGIPGIVGLAVNAGVPFVIGPGGRVELVDPVREALSAHGPLAREVAVLAAAAYVERAQGPEAIRVLVSAGEMDRAAETAAALTPQEVSRLDVRELRALFASIPEEALDRHPRALMHLARACEASAERALRAELLARAATAADGDAALRREVDAERSRDLVRDGEVAEARVVAERLLTEAGPEELQTRVRALHVLGRTHAWSGEQEGLAAAEPLLEEAAELYGRLGFQTARAHALLALAYDVQTLGGRFEAAVGTLERALAGLPARSRLRGVVLVFLAEALIDLGRPLEAEASLAEAERLGEHYGDTRTLGYTGWLRARAAASLGDADRVRAQLAEAERHRGEWFVHHTGAEFLAEASLLLGQVGEAEPAQEYLLRALQRAPESPKHVALAEGAFEARYGDAERAEALLAELAVQPDLDVRERWRPDLLRAWAAQRRGDAGRAAALVRDALAQARRMGAPDLPLRREPEIATTLVALLDGSSAEPAPLGPPPTSISVLGGFEARRAGAALDLPAGRPTALVKLLAVHGGRRSVDAVIEDLWPGVDEPSGRKRLRNVLNRLREAGGDLVVRDGPSLSFVEGTTVDAALFDRRATDALGGPDIAASLERARGALALYVGEALPDERYEDWAAEPRERFRARALQLLDLLAAGAEREGDLDEALRLLERAIESDRIDESRYLRTAALLLRQGRRGRALDVLRASAAALGELGLEPSAEHRALVRASRS